MSFFKKLTGRKDATPHIKYPITAEKNSLPSSGIYFREGDQFLVVDDSDAHHYQVFDPNTKQSVKVDKRFFTKHIKQHNNPLFGTCLYKFEATHDDELSLDENEQFLVISKVNEEWYFGKSITKVAAGIIPISYVEVRDAKSGKIVHKEDMGLPDMEEYEMQNKRQKDISIPLNLNKRTSRSLNNALQVVENQIKKPRSESFLFQHGNSKESISDYSDNSDILEEDEIDLTDFGHVLSLNVAGSIINAQLKTEFTIFCRREKMSCTLYRGQQDFITLHSQLQANYQIELPNLPTPITFWTREKTDLRIAELDSYISKISELADELSQGIILKEFLRPRQFDKLGGLYREPSDIEVRTRTRRASSF